MRDNDRRCCWRDATSDGNATSDDTNIIDPYSAGIDFRRQNLTSTNVTF